MQKENSNSSPTVRELNENSHMLTPFSPGEEHILRSFVGFDSRRNRVRTSSVVTNPYEDLIADDAAIRNSKPRNRSGKYSKYSPTPSIKRGKAEKLLKEHGSPPGIRVTAGGRIVPDGLSPISSPNFDAHSSFKQEHINRFSQNSIYNKQASTMPQFFNGFVVDLGGGPLHQVVDGELRPIEHDNGVLQLYLPAPNLGLLPDTSPMMPYPGTQGYLPFLSQSATQIWPRSEPTPVISGPCVTLSQVPSEGEIRLMEQARVKLEQELKDLDRNEVLQRALLTQAKKSEIVRTRISLVNRIDESRRAVENAKKLLQNGAKLNNTSFHPYTISTTGPLADQHYNQSGNIRRKDTTHEFQPNQTAGFASQSSTTCNEFQPEAPAFVPQKYKNPTQGESQSRSVLHERTGNVGLGLRYRNQGNDVATEAIKPVATNVSNRNTGCMNLDGSAHQPRRSHAIEIKKPEDDLARNTTPLTPKSQYNSPCNTATDRSRNSDGQGEILSFIPSPSLAAQMDSLLQSPQDKEDRLNCLGHDTNQSSESSATTADFFPHDTHEHSANRKNISKKDIQVNLPAWMPQNGQFPEAETGHTPARPPNELVFNDENPPDVPSSTVLNAENREADRNELTERCKHQRESTVAIETTPLPSGILQLRATEASGSSEDNTLHLSKVPTAGGPKSEAYWEGYQTGIHQDVLGNNKGEDYRIGYRDGLLRSNLAMEYTLGMMKRDNPKSQIDPCASYAPTAHAGRRGRVSSVIKATSFPSFGGPSVSLPSVPIPPVNSLSTTPTKDESAKKERSPGVESPLDSPTARADFMSRPNVNFNAIHESPTSKNAPASNFKGAEGISPLRDRHKVNVASDFDLPKGPSFAKRMQTRGHAYDQQRYQKSSTSVAQTNQNARAQFPSQYDGSAEDEEPMSNEESNYIMPTTPSSKSKNKGKASGSPVKAKASVAVATMKHVAGIGTRREDLKKEDQVSTKKSNKKQKEIDPALMSSPEKRRWRENWGRNFRQLKKEEQEEIEKYKRDNPIH